MMAPSWAESTREETNYGRFINQFPPNIIRINQNYEDKKMSIMFNQIYINEEVLPIYIYIYTYIYIYKREVREK